jgi:NAD+ synthase (glutamine-hydrolysing)
VLGLSGGIDSAVCAAIAADAIGADRVFGVSLPSKYSSDHSKSDAFDLAQRLGVKIRTEAIADIVDVAETQLKLDGLAAENLQARVRGLILMALSNAEGHLTLTTGNKTELAVGYSTIYGDSVGGYAPIKDVAKTMVWDLARWRNQQAVAAGLNPPIPENHLPQNFAQARWTKTRYRSMTSWTACLSFTSMNFAVAMKSSRLDLMPTSWTR